VLIVVNAPRLSRAVINSLSIELYLITYIGGAYRSHKASQALHHLPYSAQRREPFLRGPRAGDASDAQGGLIVLSRLVIGIWRRSTLHGIFARRCQR
jgi:hypothetical protein